MKAKILSSFAGSEEQVASTAAVATVLFVFFRLVSAAQFNREVARGYHEG